jgi:hypothetical protein
MCTNTYVYFKDYPKTRDHRDVETKYYDAAKNKAIEQKKAVMKCDNIVKENEDPKAKDCVVTEGKCVECKEKWEHYTW